MRSSNPVLLVEDDVVNATSVEKAFHGLGMVQPLIHARNGQEALEYLGDRNRKKPDIILLDLRMPKMNGIEFLKAVKADPALKSIPVIMLTTSQDQQDIAECFALGAAGYMIKPLDDEHLAQTLRIILQYWSVSELPNRQIAGQQRHISAAAEV
jgi:CheY-like chemotaxis protein